jgi:hypothetical protein
MLKKMIQSVAGWMRDNLKGKNLKDYHGKFLVKIREGKVVYIENTEGFEIRG